MQAYGALSVDYLDITISYDGSRRLAYDVYRKPLALFHYVPRTSCHPTGTFKAIIQSEAYRLLRRCDSREKANIAINFFRQKLYNRGYQPHEISAAFKKALVQHSFRVPSVRSTRKFYLKLPYSSNVQVGKIRGFLNQSGHIFQGKKIGITYSVQKNLFRTWHPWMWHN